MSLIWADRGYAGDLAEWLPAHLGWHLEVVEQAQTKQAQTKQDKRDQVMAEAKRRRDAGASTSEMYAGLTLKRGFQVVPRRWVVERTFAWLGQYRRFSKDYEYLPESSEAIVHLAMTRLMLRRLAKVGQKQADPIL